MEYKHFAELFLSDATSKFMLACVDKRNDEVRFWTGEGWDTESSHAMVSHSQLLFQDTLRKEIYPKMQEDIDKRNVVFLVCDMLHYTASYLTLALVRPVESAKGAARYCGRDYVVY